MNQALVERPSQMDASIVERVLIHGDLRQLTPGQKVAYYNHVCESIGLNPITKPFEYIVLNGKETLYAKRDATDQLRKIHNVSVQIVAREVTEDCYVVTARATLPTNRQDESIGAVPIAQLRGEARANAMMKGETKAKRRVTLSICGLGMLDETEIESLHQASAPPALGDGNGRKEPSGPNGGDSVNTLTGEVLQSRTAPAGYHFVQGYTFRNGWHEASLLHYDAQGGALTVSTKKKIGEKLQDAEVNGIPVMVTTSEKKNGRPGEAYLDTIQLLPKALTDAELDLEIAKQETARQAGEVP